MRLKEPLLSLLWLVTFPGSVFGPIGSVAWVAFVIGFFMGERVH